MAALDLRIHKEPQEPKIRVRSESQRNQQQQQQQTKTSARRQLFPEKLWHIVNKPNTGVQWSADGRSIEVERAQFENYIGTKFRSHKFDSFIRQLHFYGFRKSANSYHHEKFQRGRPEGLLSMKRKYSNHRTPTGGRSPSRSPSSSPSPRGAHLGYQINDGTQ